MIWIIVGIIIAACILLWFTLAMASRGSREEERRQLAKDIDEFLKGLNHGD